jgi:peptidoglycan/LPS O-acetylase OafA/YrhL
MPEISLQSEYRPDIDGLRAIAVLSILLFHLGFPRFGGGFVGVDVFFVISGFLITRLIKKEIDNTGKFVFLNFYARRIRRLFPSLFVTLFFTTVAAGFLFSPVHLKDFGGSLASALASFSNIYFWLEADYFDVSARVKPLLHTWSLSVEEQFYFIWPVTFFLLYSLKKRWILFAVLFFSALMSLYLSWVFADGSVGLINRYLPKIAEWIADGRTTIFFLIPFRIFEFTLGASLVWLVHCPAKSRYIYDLLFCLGLALILYAAVIFNEDMLFPSYFALVPCLGTAFIIYAGAYSRFSAILNNRVSIGIGLISYSLYLVHWPIVVFWAYLKVERTLADQVAMAALSFVLAYCSYRYIECPFRYRRIDLGDIRWKSSSIVAVVLLAAVGIHMQQQNGWPWRISSPVNFEDVGDAADFHKAFYGGKGYPYYGPMKTAKPAEIVLMGDSHGRHYAEGIYKELARPDGKSLYIASGKSFLHLPSFTRTTRGFNWEKIAAARMHIAFSYIDKALSPPLVILSHDWLSQMSTADILDAKGRRRHVQVGVEDIITGIRALKKRIGESPLVVIGEVPGTGGENLYDILTRPTLPFFFDRKPEDFLVTPIDKAKMQFNRRLFEVSRATGEFVFLDPYDVLCKDEMCRNTDEKNRLIYSDTHHLSKYGSRTIIRAFLPQLRQILQDHFVDAKNSGNHTKAVVN